MKTPEILLASAVIAVVAGVGTALATRAFQDAPVRAEVEARGGSSEVASPLAGPSPEAQRALNELRLDNAALRERLVALEARLAEFASTRTPLAVESDGGAGLEFAAARAARQPSPEFAVDDDFVASVGRALDQIEAKDAAARELRRKEQQALRIEERVAQLQQELGLTNRQASDVRTTLIGADDKREALFAGLRENQGDPRELRDGFRTLRDETYTALQGVLTPEQFETFKKSDESDFGRRDFGGPGGPGGAGAPGSRPDRQGRGQRSGG